MMKGLSQETQSRVLPCQYMPVFPTSAVTARQWTIPRWAVLQWGDQVSSKLLYCTASKKRICGWNCSCEHLLRRSSQHPTTCTNQLWITSTNKLTVQEKKIYYINFPYNWEMEFTSTLASLNMVHLLCSWL